MAEASPRRLFNVKATITLIFCLAYVGVLVWATVTEKLELPSFISGLGPGIGAMLRDWYKSEP